MRVFKSNFTSTVPEYMVFSVTGEGGVGKSTLLQQFEDIATAPDVKAIVTTSDDRHISPASVMGNIADVLATFDIRHKEFDERYRKYRELREEIESDPKAPRGVIDLLARGATDFAIKSGRKIPGVGIFLEGTDEKAAGETLSQLISYGIARWGNKDEVRLLRETDRVLTPLFLDLIAEACQNQRLVLIFDVFERTSQSIASWLLALFDFEFGEFDTNLSFVIAGRDPLEQHWTELSGSICHIVLEPFTPDETRLYLANQGITNIQLVTQIYEHTGGLPVLVELLAATKPEPGMPLPDVSKDAVERFLRWIPQEDRRHVCLLAAVPRQFNRDLLTAALGSDASSVFGWLASQSFVRTTAERGFFYHEKVRELMLRHLQSTTPRDLTEAHGRLAEYFAKEQAVLNLDSQVAYESGSWRKLEFERVYHLVSVQPDKNCHEAINAFLHAFRWQWQIDDEVIKVCQQVGHEQDSFLIKEIADTLGELYSATDDEYQTWIDRVTRLERYENLTPLAKCEILAVRGYALAEKECYEEALADLSGAIELDNTYAWPLSNRGVTYVDMARYEEAVADFSRAIELDNEDEVALACRAETYRLLDKYEEALADFSRAIELDNEYGWALACRGSAYASLEKYEAATADFSCAIELDEKDSWALGFRGRTFHMMEKYAEALADFSRAIELDDKDSWALVCRGDTYQAMENYEEALADFSRAIELDDKDSWPIASRGDAYREMGRYEEALADLSRAIELDERNDWAIISRGETYQIMQKYDEALADFSRAIELAVKDRFALAWRGRTYQMMEKYEEALADFSHVLEFHNNHFGARCGVAACHLELGSINRYEEQIKILEKQAETENDYNRACLAAICRDVDNAIALLRTHATKRRAWIRYMGVDPDFHLIRDDPRFVAFLQELTAVWSSS